MSDPMLDRLTAVDALPPLEAADHVWHDFDPCCEDHLAMVIDAVRAAERERIVAVAVTRANVVAFLRDEQKCALDDNALCTYCKALEKVIDKVKAVDDWEDDRG